MSLIAEDNELLGKIIISRPSGRIKEEYVNIAIVDQTSGTEFVDLRIAIDDFARALTGQGYVECVFEFRGANAVIQAIKDALELAAQEAEKESQHWGLQSVRQVCWEIAARIRSLARRLSTKQNSCHRRDTRETNQR